MPEDSSEPKPASTPSTVDLEIKLTYLEDTVQELNKIVFHQQTTIDKLQKETVKLREQVEQIEDVSKSSNLPHEKPPHY